MAYYIGQFLGIAATICCFLIPLLKKKWQMLVLTATANLFFALNMILIGESGSAILIYAVSVVQALVSLWHVQRDKPVTKIETAVFLLASIGCGAIGFSRALDLLPIGGAVFNMLATFQRDEQKSRVLILFNAICFFSFCFAVGSTSMFAELMAMITTVIAMIKYRKPKGE